MTMMKDTETPVEALLLFCAVLLDQIATNIETNFLENEERRKQDPAPLRAYADKLLFHLNAWDKGKVMKETMNLTLFF